MLACTHQFMINKEKRILSGDLFVLHNVMFWNIVFPGSCFLGFYTLQQKDLVNTSLISQVWGNFISFNFLANALSLCIAQVYYKKIHLKWASFVMIKFFFLVEHYLLLVVLCLMLGVLSFILTSLVLCV